MSCRSGPVAGLHRLWVASVRWDPSGPGGPPGTQRFLSVYFLLDLGLTHTDGVTEIPLPVCLNPSLMDEGRG